MNIPDDKIASWQAVSSYVGEVFSKEEAMKQFLGMTEDEMEAVKQDLDNMSIEDMRKGVNPQTEDYAYGEPMDEEMYLCSSQSACDTDPLSNRRNVIVTFETNEGKFYLIKQQIDKRDIPSIVTQCQSITTINKELGRSIWENLKSEHNFEDMDGFR